MKRDRLPDSSIAVGDEGDGNAIVTGRRTVADIFAIERVKPAVRQFHAIDVLDGALRRNLHGQRVALPWQYRVGDIQLRCHIHAHDLMIVRKLLAVQPDFRPVIDARKIQPIIFAARGRVKAGAVPPILLVEILRHIFDEIFADIEIGIDAILLQNFQHRGGDMPHRIPALGGIAGARNLFARVRHLLGGGEGPIRLQLNRLGCRLRRDGVPDEKGDGHDHKCAMKARPDLHAFAPETDPKILL